METEEARRAFGVKTVGATFDHNGYYCPASLLENHHQGVDVVVPTGQQTPHLFLPDALKEDWPG